MKRETSCLILNFSLQDIRNGGWVTKTIQWNASLSGWVFRKMKGYYVRIWSPLGIQQEEICLICRRKNLG